MKKSRWADWFLTAGFLGFLALALAVTLIDPAKVGLVLL